jgi:hypothetical protein
MQCLFSVSYISYIFFFLGVGWDWVHLLCRPLTGLLYQPRMIDDECGAVGGIRIGKGNRSTRRKPAQVPLCPPQIPHDLTWAGTRNAAVGNQWLTAWAMARPYILSYYNMFRLYTAIIRYVCVSTAKIVSLYAPFCHASMLDVNFLC